MLVEHLVGHEVGNGCRAAGTLLSFGTCRRQPGLLIADACAMAGADRPELLASRPSDRLDAPPASLVDDRAYGTKNADIAGAAAQVATQPDADRTFIRRMEAQHKVARRDPHPRRAITALQGLLTGKGRAKLGCDLVVVQAFDRGYSCAVAGSGKGDAGPRRHVVEQQCACPAYAMLATEMGAGQVEVIAQEIGEVGAWLDRCLHRTGIDVDPDRCHAAASSIARRSTATWMCRSAALATPALIRSASATRASNCRLKLPVTRPPNSDAASQRTIGAASMAPITT